MDGHREVVRRAGRSREEDVSVGDDETAPIGQRLANALDRKQEREAGVAEQVENERRIRRGQAPEAPGDREWSHEEAKFVMQYGLDAFER